MRVGSFHMVPIIPEEQPCLDTEDIQTSCPHRRKPCLGEAAFREFCTWVGSVGRLLGRPRPVSQDSPREGVLCLLPSASASSPTLTWLLVGPGSMRITQSRESWVPYPALLLPAGTDAGSLASASQKKVSLLLNLILSPFLPFLF